MTKAAYVLGILLILVGLVWVARAADRSGRHGGRAPDRVHPLDPADTTSDRFYRGVDRPAGPDAEDARDPRTT